MATEEQRIAFIKEIAPKVRYAYKLLGKVKPSVCIGMACVESAYGTSKVMRDHNAFMGHKVGSGKTATKYWSGIFFKSNTKEEYKIGVNKVITDEFRSYTTMQQCFCNFYELLNTKLYSRVLADADYKTQMQQIKLCGYMTSSTEVNTVLSIINKYNLTEYDKEEAPAEVPSSPYTVGKVYTLQNNMYIRREPNGEKLTINELTANGKANAFEDTDGHAVIKRGTKVTCKEIRIPAKAIWMRIPSGWICAKSASGKVFIT